MDHNAKLRVSESVRKMMKLSWEKSELAIRDLSYNLGGRS